MDREVIKELIKEMSKCNLFIGKYDAKNGNEDFMYGVLAVMEFLTYMISEEYGMKFSEMFFENMIDSKKNM